MEDEGTTYVKVGDTVTRMLAGTIPMELKVAAIDDKFIYCGVEFEEGIDPKDYPGWKFDKTFGYEVDEDLGWGVDPEHPITGSFIKIGKGGTVLERDREENQATEA